MALIGGALAVGTFLATAIGTRLRIRRPTALQSSGLTITAGVAVLATIFFTLPMVALLSLVTAIFSGISKLAVDASIQERVPERLRASAFAHSETVLMIAWVVGGAIGIIPLDGRWGVGAGRADRGGRGGTGGDRRRPAARRAPARPPVRRRSGRRSAPPARAAIRARPPPAARPRPRPSPHRHVADPGEPTDPWPDAPTVAPAVRRRASGATAPARGDRPRRPSPGPRTPPGTGRRRRPGHG